MSDPHQVSLSRLRPTSLLGLVLGALMAVGIFLPFMAWEGQSLSLLDIGAIPEGANWLLYLMLLVGVGVLLCCMTDDLPGLVPLGVVFLVYPAYVFGRAAEYLGETTPAAAALSPMPGDPAALGYHLVFLASYAAILLGLFDWFSGRARRRHVHA